MKNNSELKILNILNNYYGINKNQALFLCNKYGINLNKATNSNINPFILDLLKKTIKEYYIVDDRLSYLIEDNKNDNNMELENTANYDKLDEEIKKTNSFLAVLKELQKKLD